MLGPQRWPVEGEEATALENPIDDGMCEVLVVQHAAPRRHAFIRREDHRALLPVSIVDDVEEHVRRVGAVGEIAHFVDLCGAPHNSINAMPAVMWSEAAATGVKRTAIRIPTPHYW